VVTVPGAPTRYDVGEIKHTVDGGYERTSFSEAVLYRFEYGHALSGWLKSVLTGPTIAVGALGAASRRRWDSRGRDRGREDPVRGVRLTGRAPSGYPSQAWVSWQ
jgi:hypothetical protein